MDKWTLFDKQKGTCTHPHHFFYWSAAAVIHLLNFGRDMKSDGWAETWKILIFDDSCKDILTQVVKVGELRKQGVTLNLYVFCVSVLS